MFTTRKLVCYKKRMTVDMSSPIWKTITEILYAWPCLFAIFLSLRTIYFPISLTCSQKVLTVRYNPHCCILMRTMILAYYWQQHKTTPSER